MSGRTNSSKQKSSSCTASHAQVGDFWDSCAFAGTLACGRDVACTCSFAGEGLKPRLKVGVPTSIRLLPKLKERLSVFMGRLGIAATRAQALPITCQLTHVLLFRTAYILSTCRRMLPFVLHILRTSAMTAKMSIYRLHGMCRQTRIERTHQVLEFCS